MPRYELLDHTADIGIIAYGRELAEAFSNAAYAMFDILTDADKIQEAESFEIQVSAINIEELLIAWLDELLYRYESDRVLIRRSVIKSIDNKSLNAVVFGEKVNAARHDIKTEIKNVTYHQMRVDRTDDGWKVQVIFDV